jgi:O-antigen/teichoic acid export membrane protein
MLRSILSNWVCLLVVGVMSFLITPFMVHRLGDFQFGIYTLAFSSVGYFDLLAQGIRSTLQRFVGRLHDTRDRDELNSVFSTALALTLIVGALIILLFFSLATILPAFFKLNAMQQRLFASLVILLGLNLGFGVPAALLGSYLCGLERFDLYNLLSIVRQGTRTFLILIVLLRGRGVLAVADCVLASTLMLVPLNWWMIRQIDPKLKFARKLIQLRTAGKLARFSFWTLLNNAGELLRDSTDSIVIGRVLNTALITPFTVASRLVGYFRPIITGMISPSLPRFSQLDGLGRQEAIRKLFLFITRLSALLSLAFGSMLVLHGRSLLLLWVGPRYVSSYPILVLLTVGAISSTSQLGALQFLIAKGRHRAYGIWTIGEGLANLVLSIIWARQYGIVGVALGTAVPLLVVKLSLQPWYVTRVLGISLGEYFAKALARPLAFGALFLGFCGMTTGFQANSSLWHLLGTVSWQGILLLILAYVVGLDRSDRLVLQSRFPTISRMLPFSLLGSPNAELKPGRGSETAIPSGKQPSKNTDRSERAKVG